MGQVWRQVFGQAWPRGGKGTLFCAPLTTGASEASCLSQCVAAAIVPCSHLPPLHTPSPAALAQAAVKTACGCLRVLGIWERTEVTA